jgi:preprotein translocase subunit SecE
VDKSYITISIWAGVLALVFAVLWFTGNLARLRTYILETREELRKCTWPSMDELKGSTVVVMISIVLLGVFTVVVDFVLVKFVGWMVNI